MGEGIFLETRFCFSSEKKAENAFKAIEPEFGGKHEKRAKTTASIKKNVLTFLVIASDLQALKTSMNSIAKSIALIKELAGG